MGPAGVNQLNEHLEDNTLSIDYRQAQFLLSAAEIEQLPPDTGREVAFAGRSNAGKSSALNRITGQRALARVSKTPGRTQQINVFPLPGSMGVLDEMGEGVGVSDRRLIDLPGYGYAKAPASLRAHWQKVLPQYLESRQSLQGLVLIMDVRHPLGPLDQQMLEWCAAADLGVHVLLSKADKLRRGPAGNVLQQVRPAVSKICNNASSQLFSAANDDGVDAARKQLDFWLE